MHLLEGSFNADYLGPALGKVGHFWKIAGSKYQGIGIPDFVGHVGEIFYACEVKRNDNEMSLNQIRNARDIKNEGGRMLVVRYYDKELLVKFYLWVGKGEPKKKMECALTHTAIQATLQLLLED